MFDVDLGKSYNIRPTGVQYRIQQSLQNKVFSSVRTTDRRPRVLDYATGPSG